jgi:hypothetical protein
MGSRTIALAIALALFAPVAIAAPAHDEKDREAARALMDEGKSRVKSGELARALEAFQKAHDLMHVPTTGMAVARTHYQLGHLVEARELAQEVLRYRKESGEPAVFEGARKQARELDAQLKGRIPTVRIHIRGEPAKRITVDDVEIPASALSEPVPMNPGSRIIAAYTAEGMEAKTQLALSEKDAKEIELELLPGKGKADPNAGKTAPKKVIGPSLDDPQSGGERTSAANVLVYGGFGLAVVGLIAGGVTGGLAFSKAGDVKEQCENGICDPAAESDLDSTRSMAMIANVSFAAAGAGAILGIVGLALPKRHRAATARETPLAPLGEGRFAPLGFFVGPGGGGVRGSF